MATLVSNKPGKKPYLVQIVLASGVRFSQRVKTKTEADILALNWAREHKGIQVDIFRNGSYIASELIIPAQA